jgi:hypothetical protein
MEVTEEELPKHCLYDLIICPYIDLCCVDYFQMLKTALDPGKTHAYCIA